MQLEQLFVAQFGQIKIRLGLHDNRAAAFAGMFSFLGCLIVRVSILGDEFEQRVAVIGRRFADYFDDLLCAVIVKSSNLMSCATINQQVKTENTTRRNPWRCFVT